MTQPFRLAQGGRIDRARPVSFTFDGKPYQGFAGDTIASALLANGVHFVARSFKYHRPRGITTAGADDPAGLVQVNGTGSLGEPNTRVTEQEIYDGLQAGAQNVWPSLHFDVGAANDWLSRFMPAGFYYKTFMGWPGWMFWEPFIRKAAGLGRGLSEPDAEHYETCYRHCDVLIIGGGPTGLMAALTAARSGARVILCEETAETGGWMLSAEPQRTRLGDQAPADWTASVQAELTAYEDAKVLTRTTAFGYYAHNYVGLWQRLQDHVAPAERPQEQPRQRVILVRAKQVILATGLLERHLTFHENDRPGILLSGAGQTYAERYGVLPGTRAVVFANNDGAWANAIDLADKGVQVTGIVDVRPDPAEEMQAAAAERGIRTHLQAGITGTLGRKRVLAARVMGLDGDLKSVTGDRTQIPCDTVLVSGGWSPNVSLFSQSRGQLRYDEALGAFRPARAWQQQQSVGAANGTLSLAEGLQEATEAGARAASASGHDTQPLPIPPVITRPMGGTRPVTLVPSNRPVHRMRAWVDLQNDVTAKDLKIAVQEGYDSVEHAKRYTTNGMGTDQGKIGNMTSFGILAESLAKPVPKLGSTTFRQPYKPVTFGALVGQHVGETFLPRRTTPMHDAQVEAGALFEPVGEWVRAWAYPQPGESFHAAVQREARAARHSCGVLDASTLGKIDIRGKGARDFLSRVYTNAWAKLAPGRCRYGLMLGEDGMVMDDGVTSCLADDHFHMTTTTGGAARVYAMLEDYLQTEWTDLDVYLTTTTENWAVAAVSGPNAPKLMADILDGVDPDPARFKFMSWADARIQGVPVRVFRISFTGETAYELNVPARYGDWLWRLLAQAGKPHGLTPYGTEAMHLLRAEKGFIIVGQDTDGTITPYDLRMDWIVKPEKGDFIGKRSLYRSDTVREDRKQLVGLLTKDPQKTLSEGQQVIDTPTEPAPPVPMLGHVTSAYFSPTLGRSIALALVKRGGARMGETVYVTQNGHGDPVPAVICETDFLSLPKEVLHG